MRPFYLSYLVTLVALPLAYVWAGWEGVGIAILLAIMEISLSFDNAVVNAAVLKDMSKAWQWRFLTWGMVIAVFGMRVLFPLAIVALATELSIVDVVELALNHPRDYSAHVMAAHAQIAAFGGMFLLMVFLSFLFDEEKELHWLGRMEEHLSRLGRLEAVEIVVALTLLLLMQLLLPHDERLRVLTAGVCGVVLFVAMRSVTSLLAAGGGRGTRRYSGLAGFIYLNLLDASFSLDAVVGAFAVSEDIVIIALGLSAGAMFVRSLTVQLVRKGTLAQYIYLEHGAHYAIGALAIIMFTSILYPMPEAVPGLVGIIFILAAFWSSVRHNRKARRN